MQSHDIAVSLPVSDLLQPWQTNSSLCLNWILLECNFSFFLFFIYFRASVPFFNIILNSDPFLITFTILLFDITESFINAFTIPPSKLLTNTSEQAYDRQLPDLPGCLHPSERAPDLEVEVKNSLVCSILIIINRVCWWFSPHLVIHFVVTASLAFLTA